MSDTGRSLIPIQHRGRADADIDGDAMPTVGRTAA